MSADGISTSDSRALSEPLRAILPEPTSAPSQRVYSTGVVKGVAHLGDVNHYYGGERDDQLRFDRLLHSLSFPELNIRSNQVSESYPQTFEWIFDDAPQQWDSFSAWLRSNEKRPYWIHGKPGSGKSTLMS